MGTLEQFPWLRTFRPRKVPDEPANLLMWRGQSARLMFAYGAIVLPLSMIYILPLFIAERKYGLIAIDAAFWLFMICQIFAFKSYSKVNEYLALGALYAMTMTFVVSLGPFQARPAWLVLCTVFAGILFGIRGAIAAALFDAAILMGLYELLGSENKAWASVYTESMANWVVFAFNTSLLALASGLTAGVLLNRLDRSLRDQRTAAETLLKRSKDLEEAYGLLQSEMMQRQVAEKALIQSEARLNRAQEIANLGSWEVDLVNDRLTWSDEVYRIFGLQPQEFDATYEAFLDAVHPDDRATVDAFYSDSVWERKGAYEIEHRVVRKSTGEIRIVHEKCEHIRDASGRIIGSLGMVHDITERKRMEEELRKSRDEQEIKVKERTAELELRNKELQDFAFVASHDLQEPLRTVQTFGRMLADKCGVSLDETSRDYIRRMEKAAVRMQNLLDALLSYSRVTTKLEPFKKTDLSECVEEALSNLEIAIMKKSARVEVGDLPSVKADRVQMVQLFQNLIGNALKFSREDDSAHVKIYAQEVRDANGAYEICVEDNGIGFDEKYLDKIFHPFQRLHGRGSDYEGVGMGLAICKKIVERHGGEITARSESGKGSTFMVRFPEEKKE